MVFKRSKSKHKSTRSTGLCDDTDWDVKSGIIQVDAVETMWLLVPLLLPLLLLLWDAGLAELAVKGR